jgi:hypothetical protein
MGKGGQRDAGKQLTWTEVQKHTTRDDRWIVIDREVYDVTNWSKKHPGGSRLISHYAGQDATVRFYLNQLTFNTCAIINANVSLDETLGPQHWTDFKMLKFNGFRDNNLNIFHYSSFYICYFAKLYNMLQIFTLCRPFTLPDEHFRSLSEKMWYIIQQLYRITIIHQTKSTSLLF